MRPELVEGAAAQVAGGCPRHRGGWPDPGGGVAPVLRTSVVWSQQNTRGWGESRGEAEAMKDRPLFTKIIIRNHFVRGCH